MAQQTTARLTGGENRTSAALTAGQDSNDAVWSGAVVMAALAGVLVAASYPMAVVGAAAAFALVALRNQVR